MKLTRFFTAKEYKKTKRQHNTKRHPMDWEKIFANDVTGKVLISKTYGQFVQLNKKETIQSKNGQKTKKDISPKTFRWPIST